jgi:hypothetical protein
MVKARSPKVDEAAQKAQKAAQKSAQKPAQRGAARGAQNGASLVDVLEARFEANVARHRDVTWARVTALLDARAIAALTAMEESGGEPDVVTLPGEREITFVDCAAESPAGRRSLCFDRDARIARKDAPPKSSALEVAEAMGVEILDEADYRALQAVGAFDTKTSSWIATPVAIRALDGALFCDRRYDHVFTYHNGAQSYYAARGFRAKLRLR